MFFFFLIRLRFTSVYKNEGKANFLYFVAMAAIVSDIQVHVAEHSRNGWLPYCLYTTPRNELLYLSPSLYCLDPDTEFKVAWETVKIESFVVKRKIIKFSSLESSFYQYNKIMILHSITKKRTYSSYQWRRDN